jgi:exodeoxyribonuclease VII large subunit
MTGDPDNLSNLTEYTVSELSASLKRTVETEFGQVRVRAELSGVSRPASGHIYMALKDDKALMDAVCWKGLASKLTFKPEDGLEVICTGKLTTYPARSKYQMIIEWMEPAGAGALMALLEERKKKLAAEGLFDPARKKKIPYMPKVIGVITSPTGAVIRDILHRLNDRFQCHVIVWPVKVQGQGADREIAAAIEGFNALDGSGAIARPDLLIVARGGGSIEDLWSFNEECVVRAAAASTIPLISSVGHETDTTLIDYASDLRAPTPTAAAEMAVPVRAELLLTVSDLSARLERVRGRMITERLDRLRGLTRGLPSPKDMLGMATQRLDELNNRLPLGLKSVAQNRSAILNKLVGGLSSGRLKQMVSYKKSDMEAVSRRLVPAGERRLVDLSQRLTTASRMMESLSYERVLERGYVVIINSQGKPVSKAASLKTGEQVTTKFHDGDRKMIVDGEGAPIIKTVKVPKKSKPPMADRGQGNLF